MATTATRRAMLGTTAAGIAAILGGCAGGGDDGGSGSPTATTTTMTDDFTVETSAFADGGTVPQKYTCDGADVIRVGRRLQPGILFVRERLRIIG
jgi:hypothetical protein